MPDGSLKPQNMVELSKFDSNGVKQLFSWYLGISHCIRLTVSSGLTTAGWFPEEPQRWGSFLSSGFPAIGVYDSSSEQTKRPLSKIFGMITLAQ